MTLFASIINELIIITASNGTKKIKIKKLALTILLKFPLNISQNSCQRLVGNVLLAYSSLRSFPSSIRVINPFFCCAIQTHSKKVFRILFLYPFFYFSKRGAKYHSIILLQNCDYFKKFTRFFLIIYKNFLFFFPTSQNDR